MNFLLSEPTVTYCEEPTNELIARPGYAFSNLLFIFVGVYLLTRKGLLSKAFGVSSIAIGCASFLYDATFVRWSQLIDIFFMFSFVNILLIINLYRSGIVKKWILGLVYSMNQLLYVSLFILFEGRSQQILFAVIVLAVLLSEIRLIAVENLKQHATSWMIAVGLFLTGFGIWLLDGTGTWCTDFVLLNGRAIFHYTSAVSIYLLWRYYMQVNR